MILVNKKSLKEILPGLMLLLAAITGVLMANIDTLSPIYSGIFHGYLFGAHSGHFTLEHMINDGLMCVFFFCIAIEIKRELFRSSKEAIILPVIAAIGGVVMPALLYLAINFSNAQTISGWAIPSATDIAFSLAVLSLLGNRVPLALKVFLTAAAVADDLMAIIIIALFYTGQMNPMALFLAIIVGIGVVLYGKSSRWNPHVAAVMAIILWIAIIQSGLHATIAGVIFGLSIPDKNRNGKEVAHSLLVRMQPFVNYTILPLFALANSGVALSGVGTDIFTSNLAAGIILGLVVGKPLGLFGFTYLAVRTGSVKLPDGLSLPLIFGVSLLGGIGFTMSLFVSNLAFATFAQSMVTQARSGIFIGSIISAALGYVYLRRMLHSGKDMVGYEGKARKTNWRIASLGSPTQVAPR